MKYPVAVQSTMGMLEPLGPLKKYEGLKGEARIDFITKWDIPPPPYTWRRHQYKETQPDHDQTTKLTGQGKTRSFNPGTFLPRFVANEPPKTTQHS